MGKIRSHLKYHCKCTTRFTIKARRVVGVYCEPTMLARLKREKEQRFRTDVFGKVRDRVESIWKIHLG